MLNIEMLKSMGININAESFTDTLSRLAYIGTEEAKAVAKEYFLAVDKTMLFLGDFTDNMTVSSEEVFENLWDNGQKRRNVETEEDVQKLDAEVTNYLDSITV